MKQRGRLAMMLVAPFLFLALLRFWPHTPLSRMIPLSTAMWSTDGELMRLTLSKDEQYRMWTAIGQISPDLIDAFVLKEDRWFYWHPGINPFALVRAAFRTAVGRQRQGGSTLTMQLARLLYRMNTRHPSGKLKQMAAALWLETRYSKRELIECYLNVVPFGGNVEGVGAASRIYFGKSAERVTLAEALTLAVIPQHPSTRAGRNGQETALVAAHDRLGKEWLRSHQGQDSERRQVALAIAARPAFAMPKIAPHFVDSLLEQRPHVDGSVHTTLDVELQRIVERQISRYIEQYGDHGIRNVAALLVDYRDMGVKAWVGSADYWNTGILGQVNGVLAKRSPGSTLKPFIYALALDQGILHPRTMLRDTPTSFGSFTPENFDGRFVGPITAEEALVRSRNIPAVWVATQLKQPSLYQFLQTAGVSRLKSEEYYGLALALGGGELTMEELGRLYAALANEGMLKALRTELQDPVQTGVRVLSPEASFITLDMLHKNPRPDDDGSTATRNRWPVAWKTGTSWGFRDAWSVGIAGPYVLVVWIGDFSGQGNASFVGVDAAAPLFFRIVDALNVARSEESVPVLLPPRGVSQVSVCAESGDLPNVYCSRTVPTWYIPGKSPIKVSQLHRAVAINPETGQPSCQTSSSGAVSFEVFEFWSSDMLKLFRQAGIPRRPAPSLPNCSRGESADVPRITSPLRGVSYTLRHSQMKDSINLEAIIAGDVRNLFWFDGKALIGKVPATSGSVNWRPETDGVHIIRLIDDHGRSAERDVEVHLGP